MGYLNKSPPVVARTLRVLARLLSYPDAALREHLPELGAALRTEAALSSARLAELDDLGRRQGIITGPRTRGPKPKVSR